MFFLNSVHRDKGESLLQREAAAPTIDARALRVKLESIPAKYYGPCCAQYLTIQAFPEKNN